VAINRLETMTSFSQEQSRVLISGGLNFSTVVELWSQLDKIVWMSAMHFDLSKVTQTNSAGLALLIGLLRVAKSKKTTITFINVPDSLFQLAELSGVRGFLSQ
jgi:phospholipid transport system transporter-binding protein